MKTYNNVTETYSSFSVLHQGSVTTPKGFRAGGMHCGIKRKRKDLGWIYSEVPADAAAVYTMNTFQAAPLIVTKESVTKEGKLQGIIVNSGKANACTGPKGLEDAYEMRRQFSSELGLAEHHVAVVSTGLIGENLPMDKINQGLRQIPESLKRNAPEDFEKAILTTDTFSKKVAVQFEMNGKTVSIGGAAKGSGMIHPNMATMLGFITTDINIEQRDLQTALREVTNQTFNAISVDGDTSTNDMVLLLANGLAQNEKLTKESDMWNNFIAALQFVCESLAKQIARDGEGATKLVEVQVTGVATDQSARNIAKTIISSNLVKTAIFGEDPNWGRIVCAIGYSEEQIDPTNLSISIGTVEIVKKGLPISFNEEEAIFHLEKEHVYIHVDFDQGNGSGKAWGCDLSYNYVRINASYRT
ncbi:glutamate N-acetyltransferase/amino-acid N-acetyltransferase [Salirhabdus euzebyi]|uniref:Arginine biosynthesis bifunctional protein ArgJ n=1 Tax=Salirhabdus euzebyi TaxID=394506 RepID=A0A841Q5L2_9BACI|nr:bifunctional glutamate N-acetyltransferase/amino-acid acetyltransferase ArgJ [Salirhabdus euzebyi]MBB6453759.1 glutamate N-acetyltransferase/amino-acid N-acetyltransferase [Salirhabdus euzebyi]